MQIYKAEIIDGISELIRKDNSIAYCSQAVLTSEMPKCEFVNKLKASSNPNQIDLHYIKSVLVSTGWNKNDDVFSNAQTWAARNTPEDKQFNFMHNENDIIGHITGSYVVDRNGQKIEADVNDVPSEFDIITEAVLYNSWSNPDNRERMQKIIAEIEQGKWFVSMECLFSGFDYAVIDPKGEAKVVARNDESAFLTKHLRAYGGTGEYEGYKIGRSLRDISFSGKGLVSKPANPRSIILDSSKAFTITEQYVSNVSKGDFNMQDNNEEKQLSEELASSTEQVTVTQSEAEAELSAKISAFEIALAEKDEAIKTLEAAILSLQETLLSKDALLSESVAAMNDMKKKEKNRMRKEQLMASGFEEAEAEESLSFYDNLEDSAFEAIVAMYKKKMAKMDSKTMTKKELVKDEEDEDKKTKSEIVSTEAAVAEEATEELFDGVSSTEAALVDASNDKDELAATRASVAEWLTENVLRK
jgi:hypothetical protein